jgi:hypothetical protein
MIRARLHVARLTAWPVARKYLRQKIRHARRAALRGAL